jgi:sec-independent protein translocase protein TatA
MGSFGPLEIFLVFLVILLVFGAKRIPEIARGLGKGISEFKRATKEFTNEFDVNDPSQIDRSRRPSQGNRAPGSQPNQQAHPRQQTPGAQSDASAPQGGAQQGGSQSQQAEAPQSSSQGGGDQGSQAEGSGQEGGASAEEEAQPEKQQQD